MDGFFAEKSFDIPAAQATANAKLKFNRQTADANNRFFISDIIIEKNTTGLKNILPENFKIYAVEGGIRISTKQPANVQIFSMVGEKIKDINLVQGVHTTNLAQGLYIVKISNYAVKLVVK